MARRVKGEGSLYQAGDKSWVYQYQVDGTRKTKRFRKKADAKAFIAALTAGPPTPVAAAVPTLAQGPARKNTAQELLTLGEWMDRWLEVYAKPTVKLSTYCSY